MDLMKRLKICGIKKLVYAEEVREYVFQAENLFHIQTISALDTRSAVYMATGICAQNQEPVVVLVSASSSRSAFSGMTEAYYRKLPVILITIGTEVDYSVELKDVVMSHVKLPEYALQEQWDMALTSELPMHIELGFPSKDKVAIQCKRLMKVLEECLDDRHYLLLSQDIGCDASALGCKVVHNGITGCRDGALSNTLGASLAQKHQRYIGVVSEREFFHDMNVLGNVHVNDLLFFVIVATNRCPLILDYAKSLGFEVAEMSAIQLNCCDVIKILNNKTRTIMMVWGEEL